jgi:hypothetical protein
MLALRYSPSITRKLGQRIELLGQQELGPPEVAAALEIGGALSERQRRQMRAGRVTPSREQAQVAR